jgi:hypothetical protein
MLSFYTYMLSFYTYMLSFHASMIASCTSLTRCFYADALQGSINREEMEASTQAWKGTEGACDLGAG